MTKEDIQIDIVNKFLKRYLPKYEIIAREIKSTRPTADYYKDSFGISIFDKVNGQNHIYSISKTYLSINGVEAYLNLRGISPRKAQ